MQTLGVPIEVVIRIQINIRMSRNEDISLFSNLPNEDLYFPVLWLESNVRIPPELASKLSMVIKMPEIASSVGLAIALFGLIALVIAVAYQQFRAISNDRNQTEKKTLQLSEEEIKEQENLSLVE